MRHPQTVERGTGVAQLGFANQESGYGARAGIAGREPLRDEAVGLRARVVAELACDQQIAKPAQPVIISKSAAGSVREIGNGTGVIGAGGKFQARARGLVLPFFEGIGAGAENDVAILPAQDGPRGSGGAKHPTPIVGRDLLIGLAAQSFQGAEDGAENDFEQRGVLIAHLNILLHCREEARQSYLDGINAGRQGGAGKATVLVGQQLEAHAAEEPIGGNNHGGAHLRSSGRVHDQSSYLSRGRRGQQRSGERAPREA